MKRSSCNVIISKFSHTYICQVDSINTIKHVVKKTVWYTSSTYLLVGIVDFAYPSICVINSIFINSNKSLPFWFVIGQNDHKHYKLCFVFGY